MRKFPVFAAAALLAGAAPGGAAKAGSMPITVTVNFIDAMGVGKVLHRIIEALQKDPQHRTLAGGLYSSTIAHGPFVHVDVRGHTARWQGTPPKKDFSGQ